MKTSKQCMDEMIENLGNEWKEKLDYFLKNEDVNYEQEVKNYILNFLNACKEDVIEGDTQKLKKIEKTVDNDLLYKNISVYIEGMLKPYFAAAPLRVYEVKDENLTNKIIEEVFMSTILRYNPDILNRYAEYGFTSEDDFVEYISILDVLCSFVVERNYCYETIEDVVYSHMRLSKASCKKIATLIDSNFDKLKVNYIIEKLGQTSK